MPTDTEQKERAIREAIANFDAEVLDQAVARIVFKHLWATGGDHAPSDWEDGEQHCSLDPYWHQDALLVGDDISEDCKWARMPHSRSVRIETDSLKPGTRQFLDEYVADSCPSCGERHQLRGFLGAHAIRCMMVDEETGQQAEFYIYSHESLAELREWFQRQFWSKRFRETRAKERTTKKRYARFVDCYAELSRLPLSEEELKRSRLLLWHWYRKEAERLSKLPVRPLCANTNCRKSMSNDDELYCQDCRPPSPWSQRVHEEAAAERRRRGERPLIHWGAQQDRFYKALDRGKKYILRHPPEGRAPSSLRHILGMCDGFIGHRTTWARYWMSDEGRKLFALKASSGPDGTRGDVCANDTCEFKSDCQTVLDDIKDRISGRNR